ncbi:thioredoxin [Streptomyces jumonjinensis]|uniref:thioredoxin n=1 Tax=Streptomyces jumonjinensis TaxID=1945 RepID=UPI0037893C5E
MTAEQTGVRVQLALDRLAGGGAREAGEELVRELMSFYGEGLAGIVRGLPPHALDSVLDDPAAAGLLVLHELHPEPVGARVERALAALPRAHAGLVGFDPGSGALTLRRAGGGGCGCAGGAEELEGLLACHAPEVTSIVWEREPALLQIGAGPPRADRPGPGGRATAQPAQSAQPAEAR